MQKTISFKFETEIFQVQLESDSDPSLLFLNFLKNLDYLDSSDNVFDLAEDLKFVIFSNNDELTCKEIKEKALSLGLKIVKNA